MTGCTEEGNPVQDASSAKVIEVISANELKNIINSSRVVIGDDSLCQGLWIPKNQKNTLLQITSWLHQARPYKGEIPKSANEDDRIEVNAYIGPSVLHIYISDNHRIFIKPYINITDVLQLDIDGQKTYIESHQLYDWLKNDKWKSEFKHF